MQLNQLADQLSAKTIHLIAIAKALTLPDLPNPHGGTPLSPEHSQQITALYRYMRDRQISDPAAAVAQMNDQPADADEIAIRIRASVADELCQRYPTGSMSDRILKLLGAVQVFEQVSALCVHPQAITAPIQPTTQP